MTYTEYKKQRQAEFNALPIFFAFSNEQFKEACNKRGFEPENAGEFLYRLAGGGFYLKTDDERIQAFFNRDDPLPKLMENPDFAVSAFYYEMANHEYHINSYQGNYDVISCFGDIEYDESDDYREYFRQLGWSESLKASFLKARRKFLKDADENDWY